MIVDGHWIPPNGLYLRVKDVYVTGHGQIIGNLHPCSDDCRKHGCPVHSPSDHSMRDFPTLWRDDRGLMERICPHGVGHPDPDSMAFVSRAFGKEAASTESVHGCDGCCRGAYAFWDDDDA